MPLPIFFYYSDRSFISMSISPLMVVESAGDEKPFHGVFVSRWKALFFPSARNWLEIFGVLHHCHHTIITLGSFVATLFWQLYMSITSNMIPIEHFDNIQSTSCFFFNICQHVKYVNSCIDSTIRIAQVESFIITLLSIITVHSRLYLNILLFSFFWKKRLKSIQT